MTGESHNHEQIVREAGQSLAFQQSGGRRRSIGKASAQVKMKHFGKKIRNIILAIVGIFFAAGAIGLVIDGIGFTGIMLAIGVAILSTMILSNYPKLRVPRRADLQTEDVRKLVGQTELWLEAQRPSLPPPAAEIIGAIGVQLDTLGVQLEEVDQKHPTAIQIRKLIGTDLPEMIDGFNRIPEKLRYEERTGATPTNQLVQGLGLISTEIDSITRQLANGALDDLAIRSRYLDYKYGDGGYGANGEVGGEVSQSALEDQSQDSSSGVPLDFDKDKAKTGVKAERS